MAASGGRNLHRWEFDSLSISGDLTIQMHLATTKIRSEIIYEYVSRGVKYSLYMIFM